MNYDRRGCANEVNKLMLEYNTRLEEKIFALNADLSEGLIIFSDFFEPFRSSSTMLKTMLGQGTYSVK